MLKEMLERVQLRDPVCGRWQVEDKGTVWCDAISIALGVCLTINGQVVEDASWMRKADDCGHTNVAELNVVLKRLNLTLK